MIVLDPLLPADQAEAMVRLWHEVGDFGQDGATGPVATYAPLHDTAVVLDTDTVFHGVARLVDDLVTRGRLASGDDRPGDAELGRLLIDEYIRFPLAAPA